MKETGCTITSMGKVATLGPMVESIKVNGKITKCMEKVHSLGLMVACTKDGMKRTK